MKKTTKKKGKYESSKQVDLQQEGLVNILIGLNTFPVESDEELEVQKGIIEELKKLNENNNKSINNI